ncbi:deoxycytidyl transferase [Blyttiomyces sp. JEL0837]|nr:deoxycytidyl transferase [Blyttiomyces sp. JEL0837]
MAEWREVVLQNGGVVFDRPETKVTHIVAENLTDRKVALCSFVDVSANVNDEKVDIWRNKKVVNTKWIDDSIAAGKPLPWHSYSPTSTLHREQSQSTLPFQSSTSFTSNLAKSPIKPPTDETPAVSAFDNAQIAQPQSSMSTENNVQGEGHSSTSTASWMAQNSSTAAGFISKYYASSRLSMISNWKCDLKEYVAANAKPLIAEKSRILNDALNGKRIRTIFHVDLDCFFASVAVRDRPAMKNRAIAICHSAGVNAKSTSEIASCNYEARAFGVRNGMLLGKAKGLCPELVTLPYEFEKYQACSKSLYDILLRHGDEVMAISCDEAYIDVSCQISSRKQGELELAESIRSSILTATGCNASIGIGDNMLTARMATKRAKPNGVFILTQDDIAETMLEIPAKDLPGVGYALAKQLDVMGISTCGDLQQLNLHACKREFGEANGQKMWEFCRGIDKRPLSNKKRQSIGAEVNWGIRFETADQAEKFLLELAGEVSQRLVKNRSKGRHITLKLKRKLYEGEPYKLLGCGECLDLSKGKTLERSFDDGKNIFKEALRLFRDLNVPVDEIRGVGIQITKLDTPGAEESLPRGQHRLSFLPLKRKLDDPRTEISTVTSSKVPQSIVQESLDVNSSEQSKRLKFTNLPEPDVVRRSSFANEVNAYVSSEGGQGSGKLDLAGTLISGVSVDEIDNRLAQFLPENIMLELQQVISIRQALGGSRLLTVGGGHLQLKMPNHPSHLLHLNELLASHSGRVSFCGASEPRHVNPLLYNWIQSGAPASKDISYLKEFLNKLVDNWQSDEALGYLAYMHRCWKEMTPDLCKPSWSVVIEELNSFVFSKSLIVHSKGANHSMALVLSGLQEGITQPRDRGFPHRAPLQSAIACSHVSSDSAGSSALSLKKALSRINSLEKTVEFLQREHDKSLKGLHAEISRLQRVCSDTAFKKVVLENNVAVHEMNPSREISTQTGEELIASASSVSAGSEIFVDDEKLDSGAEEMPYHLLLQQQRRKYQSFIERINSDNKRKQAEIDELRAELNLVRDVLAIAGLDLDLTELRSIVQSKANNIVGRAKKSRALPPISTVDGVVAEENHARHTPSPPAVGSMIPGQYRRRLHQGPTEKYHQQSPIALAHDAAPYGRGRDNIEQPHSRMYMSPQELSDNEQFDSKFQSNHGGVNVNVNNLSHDTEQVLPPVTVVDPRLKNQSSSKSVKSPSQLPILVANQLEKGVTAWTKRIKGAKIVREKLWKEYQKT